MGGTKRNNNHTLTRGQLQNFKQVISNSPKHDLLFSLTLFYGLRVSEVHSLRLSDINSNPRQITIQGKKGGRKRTYFIPQALWKKIQEWLKERNQNPKHKNNPYLFPHRLKEDQPMTRIGVQYDFKSFSQKAGIEGHSVHDLRHTCAMLQVEKGTDPIRLRNWLRQKQIQSTQKYFEEFNDRQYEKKVEDTFKDLI